MRGEDKAWIEWQEKFSDQYDNACYSKSLRGWVMRAGHRLTEKSFGTKTHFSQVLEVGAGTGEHFPFILHSFDRYILTDTDIKTLNVAKKKLKDSLNGKLKFEIQEGSSLTYPDSSFDRLIAAHVLEHIYFPHLAIKEWVRVLKHGGVLSILIPTDPGIIWRVGRYLGPRRDALAKGLSYDFIIARQHVNPCINLISILRHYFPEHKEEWWPFPICSTDLNLFFVFHASITK